MPPAPSNNDSPFEQKHLNVLRALQAPQVVEADRLVYVQGVQPVEFQFTAPGWNSYFWQEGRSNAGQWNAFQAALLGVFNYLFRLPDAWDQDIPQPLPGGQWLVRQGGHGWTDAAVAVHLTTYFSGLMDIGFYHTGDLVGAVVNGAPNADMTASMVDPPARVFAWRGDNRTWPQIQGAGFQAKADVNVYAAPRNMRQAWNPYNNANRRLPYWYRRNMRDNDLYTVVSLTPAAQTGCTFPLIDTLRFGDPALPLTLLEEQNRRFLRNEILSAVVGQSDEGYVLMLKFVDRVKLYLCSTTTPYFDTAGMQARQAAPVFPEFAVKAVGAGNIHGYVTFYRVFHTLQDAGGFTLKVDENNTELFDGGPAGTAEAFQQAMGLDGNSYRWTDAGAAAVASLNDGEGHDVQVLDIFPADHV